jgi:sterol O-acyltransferase
MILKVMAFAADARKKVRTSSEIKEFDKDLFVCSFQHYVYYHFAPVMVYRDFYPRSSKTRNWRRILTLSLHYIGCQYVLLIGLRHLIVTHFSRVGIKPFTLSDIGDTILLGYWFGIPIMLFGLGYGLLHCWLNVWAEILRFGDRHFYQEWWASTSPADFLRKWNNVVGDWIFEYAYVPIMNRTRSRILSAVAIYTVSAIIHDYGLYGMLGFFMPLHTLVYPSLAFLGDVSLLVINRVGLFKDISNMYGNTLLHMFSYFSFSIWVGISTLEYYSRINCPETLDDSWMERFGLKLHFPQCITIV